MTRGKDDDGASNFSSRSDIRVPISAVVGLVLSVAAILYGQIQFLHHSFEQKLALYGERLERKADKSQAGDRYTGKQAREREKAVNYRFEAVQSACQDTRKSFRREIDNLKEQLRELGKCGD